MNKKSRIIQKRPVTKFVVLLSAICLIGFGFILNLILLREIGLDDCNLNSTASSFESFNKSFTLLNSNGTEVSNEELFKKPSLVYFGYTYCPDICPFDLIRNSSAVEMLDSEGIEITPIFITLDPNRDTMQRLRDYTQFHHPRMIGLTGSKNQIESVKKIYKVYSEMPSVKKEGYLVNHSTFTYLVIPKFGVQTYFTRKDSSEKIVEDIKCVLDKHNN